MSTMEADIERGSILPKHFSPAAIAFLRDQLSGVMASVISFNETGRGIPPDDETVEKNADGELALKDEGITIAKLSDSLELRLVLSPVGGALAAGRVPYCTTAGNTTDTPSIVESANINIDSGGRVSVDPSNGGAGVTPAANLHAIGSVSNTEPVFMATATGGSATGPAIRCDGAEARKYKTLVASDFPYTVLPTDNVLFVNVSTGTGNLVINLPDASGNEGRRLYIYDAAFFGGTRNIILTAHSNTRLQNGATSRSIATNGDGALVEFTDIVVSGKQQVLAYYQNRA